MNIIIEPANDSDLVQIRQVQKTTWLDTYPNEKIGITKADVETRLMSEDTNEKESAIERWRRNLNDPDSKIWVAKDGNAVVGFCMAEKGEQTSRIHAIYVLPKYQNKNIGGKLLQKAFEWLGLNKDILVNVASYNSNAINFYKKFGFTTSRKDIIDETVAPFASGVKIPEDEMVKNASV